MAQGEEIGYRSAGSKYYSCAMGNYRDLNVWQASRALASMTYRLTETFPAAERYGLTAQMRRAAVSIMSNIAEGAGRASDTQLRPFLQIARGSLHELECQTILANDLGLMTESQLAELNEGLRHAARPLQGLLRSLERGSSHGHQPT
jgi:four helix bundle protein